MSGPLLQLVDEDDAVLFDLNDPTGAANPHGLKTTMLSDSFVIGGPTTHADTFEPEGFPGGLLVRKRHGLTESSLRLVAEAASYDALLAGSGELARLLDAGGIMKFQPAPATDPRYLDYLYARAPGLYRGQSRDVLKIVELLTDLDGLPISFVRQPYWRLPRLDSDVNLLANGLLLGDAARDSRPDFWAWASAADISAEAIFANPATDFGYRFTIATGDTRDLQQTSAAGTFAPGDVATFSFYAKVSTGSGAKAQAIVEFTQADGTTVTATATGTLTALGADWVRIAVTTAAAPANTSRARVSIRIDNDDATARTLALGRAQLEEAPAATTFRAGTQVVPNDPADPSGRALLVYNPGTSPAPAVVQVKADTGAAMTSLLQGRAAVTRDRSPQELLDFFNTTRWGQMEATGRDWTLALTNDTAPATVATASPGSGTSVARTSYASNPAVPAKRVKASRTALLESLRGTFDLNVRVFLSAVSKHTLQLRWGPSQAEPAPYSEAEVPVEIPAGGASFGFFDVHLGRITIPSATALAGFLMEFWSRRDTGSGNLDWDFFELVPVDQQARLTIGVDSGLETFLGSSLVTPTNPAGLGAGTVSGTDLVLDAANEAGGTAPVGGLDWPDTVNRVRFTIECPATSSNVITLRVRNITDSTDAAILSGLTGVSTSGLWSRELLFTAAAGKLYQPQVVATTVPSATRPVKVKYLTHSVVSILAASQVTQLDTEQSRTEKVDANGGLLQAIEAAGGLPTLEPGLNLLSFAYGDVPLGTGYPFDDSILTRDCTVKVGFAPREM